MGLVRRPDALVHALKLHRLFSLSDRRTAAIVPESIEGGITIDRGRTGGGMMDQRRWLSLTGLCGGVFRLATGI